MLSDSEFTAGLHRINSFLEDMGYTDISWIEYEDSDVVTLRLINGNPSFEINCSPDAEFCSVMYEYNLVLAIAGRMDEDTAEQHIAVGYEDLQDEYTKEELAAHSIIDLLDPDDREEIVFHLHEAVLSEPVTLRMNNGTIADNFSQFRVSANIFPYEEGFSRTEFNRTIREVVAASDRAETFLKYAFNLGIEEYKDENVDSEKEIATSPRSLP